MSDELKACPFCGSKVEIFHHPDRGSMIGESWHVECISDDCGCGTCHHETPKQARAAWNTRATDAENQRLRAEVDALREDCRKLLENEPVATCESCGAWLLDGDDYVTDPDGVAGCWAAMTDVPSKTERQCYAYRVGKCDARQHLSDNAEAIARGE